MNDKVEQYQKRGWKKTKQPKVWIVICDLTTDEENDILLYRPRAM